MDTHFDGPGAKMQRMVKWIVVAFMALTASTAFAQDDAAVRTRHEIHIADKPLAYTAEAGRIALYDGAGAIIGHVFFTAYRAASGKTPRPVTFLWNGGPGANSEALHFEAFGPRRLTGHALQDNDATLLATSDLVFVDPVGTGFSRAASAASASGFYSTLGDFAAMTQFVRDWLATHHTSKAPVYLIGESFGVWRAAAVAQELEEQGQPVAGIVLISGGAGVGAGPLPRNLIAALRIPNRAATALFHGKLAPGLGADRDEAVAHATQWAKAVYAPALANVATLDATARDKITADLVAFTGLQPSQIDQHTLSVTPRAYLHDLLKDQGKVLDTFDMRRTEEPPVDGAVIETYLHHDLNYRTALSYAGLDAARDASDSTAPKPGWINEHWQYNSGVITPEVIAAAMAGEGPPGTQPWALNAIRLDPKLRVMVAAGLYDSLNSCAANDALRAALDPAVAGNFTMKCYLGGHMMYRDPEAQRKLSADVKAFESGASEH
jgi:carboxypeptidase C (cathepsin A)